MVLVLPSSLDDDAGAEDQSHQEDGVPQLLQVLLHTQREEHLYVNIWWLYRSFINICSFVGWENTSEKNERESFASLSFLNMISATGVIKTLINKQLNLQDHTQQTSYTNEEDVMNEMWMKQQNNLNKYKTISGWIIFYPGKKPINLQQILLSFTDIHS